MAQPDILAVISLASDDIDEIEVIDAVNGQFMVRLSNTDTQDLMPGGYSFDVQLKRTISGRLDIKTVAFGILNVLPDVTRSIT